MKTIYLKITQSKSIEKQKVDNTLLWYDVKNKKMHKFNGGKINFNYIYEKNEFEPKVEDLVVSKYKMKNNIQQIQNWIANSDFSIEISDAETTAYEVAIKVADNIYEAVLQDLDSNRIQYS